MMPVDLSPVWLTVKVALLTTVILIILSTVAAWWLSQQKTRWRAPLEAIVALPLVLPPTVLGFYLLLFMGPDGPLGWLWQQLTSGGQLTFSFAGLVFASVIYSLPFAMQPLLNAFDQLDQRQLAAAATLGASPFDRFWSLVLPQSRRAYLSAAILSFAHTVGEFGVVLMIGGNIPNETRVVSIAIYDHVEALEYTQAHWLSAGLLAFAFIVLLIVYSLNRQALVRS